MQLQGFEVKLDEQALPWRATRHRGIHWLPLHLASEARAGAAGGEAGGEAVVLIRMEPGRGYPEHLHLDVEDVLVLSGGYRDEQGTYPAGSYVRYPKSSRHAPVACGDGARPAGPDNPACILFAVARGGVQNVGAGEAREA